MSGEGKAPSRISLAIVVAIARPPCSAEIARRCSPYGSRGRQHQFDPQAADRRRAELDLAAIELRQLHHDRQAEAGTGLGLVQPQAAVADLLALLRREP